MTNNFDTAYTERLHIDLAKHAYAATNHKDEFTQMAKWLERKEKIFCHEQYLKWQEDGSPILRLQMEWCPPGLKLDHWLHMTKHPSAQAVPVERLVEVYGATYFRPALARFIALTNNPRLLRAQLEAKLYSICMPFHSVPVWHRIKYLCEDPVSMMTMTADSIHVWPPTINSCGNTIPGRFDTALVNEGTCGDTGIKSKPSKLSPCNKLIKLITGTGMLQAIVLVAYEWFSQYRKRPATSSSIAEWPFLNTWYMWSGILPSPIHPTAITSYTKFLPFETKLVDTYVVSSHWQVYSEVFIYFQDLVHPHLRNGRAATFSICVVLFMSIPLLIVTYTEYSFDL
jgi:hypothetical protein